MNTSKWALGAALAAMFSTAVAADRDDFGLSHYEPLLQLDVRPVDAAAGNAGEQPGTVASKLMSFNAMGRSFDLELEHNGRLMRAARQNPALDGVDIYRGEVAGREGSWARIVMVNGVPSGMFFDGEEYFAIEAPGDSVVETAVPVVFRLADAVIAPGAMSCGNADPAAMSAATAAEALLGELHVAAQAQGAVSEIELGVVGDFEFTNSKGSDANAAAAITTRINNVDGIFSAQVGVQINLRAIETFSADTDPFTTNEAGDLLDELSDYRSTNPTQNSNGLTHLYTGRDLNGSTVGIAWTGALCSNFFGAGLSEGNGSATFDSLVAAHEIGHNFGAPHDGESGSACEAQEGDWLMSPRLNGVDRFSPCTLDQMSDDIARASCITALPSVDMQVGLQSTATILFGAETDLSYEVFNNGTLDATNVVVDFTIPANVTLGNVAPVSGTCTTGTGTVSCAFGDIPGSAVRAVEITVTPNTVGAGTITAAVSADNEDRPENDQESLQLMVDPAVDLVAGTPTGASVRINQTATVTASLENRAALDATGVTLTIDLGNALRPTAASWPLGSCSVQSQRVTCQAGTFAAQSNSTVIVTATAITAGNPNITVSLASSEADIVPGDNTRNGRLEVKDAKDDSGGGTTGPLFLLLLALAAMVRRRV
jgi:MYXO-CTERM domain-containing protein